MKRVWYATGMAAAVASATLLAGCGSTASSGTGSAAAGSTSAGAAAATAQGSSPPATAGYKTTMSGMTGMSASPQAAAAAPVAVDRVGITNFAFSPQVITVKAGTTVEWTNKDADAHTVTATTAGAGPASQPLSQGATYRYTFTTAGRFDYLCTIHPFMTGTVVVTP